MTGLRTRFRVVTANLLNGRADPAAFADLVAALGPDVVAVQEIDAAQADALARTLPFGKIEPAGDHTGMGILLRRAGSVKRLPLPWTDGLLSEVGLDERTGRGDLVEILNVHVTAPHVQPFWRTATRRRGQLMGIRRHLATVARPRRLVVGDLNATPRWPLYRRLVGGLSDAALEAARGNGHRPQPTWGPWPGSPRLFRIDHILVAGLNVSRVEVIPILGSDHSAVVADLTVDVQCDP